MSKRTSHIPFQSPFLEGSLGSAQEREDLSLKFHKELNLADLDLIIYESD
jgi:hypothetical protein